MAPPLPHAAKLHTRLRLLIVLAGCADSEPVFNDEDTIEIRVSTIECIFDEYDETLLQIQEPLAVPDIEEASHLAAGARDFIERYCGLAP